MNKKIKIRLYIIIATIVYHVSIVRIVYIKNYNVLAIGLSLVVALYLMTKMKKILLRKYVSINTLLLAFATIFLFSSFYNEMNFDGTILYIIRVFELFLFMEYINEIGKTKQVAKTFLILGILYQFINYYMMIKEPFLAWKNDMNYLIGTKFSISYSAIMCIVLFSYSYQDKIKTKNKYKFGLLLLICLSIAVSMKVKCVTGTVGNFLFVLFYFLVNKSTKKVFCNPLFVICTLIISCSVLIIFYKYIQNISFVKYLIEEVFHKNLNLSGRTYVYNEVFEYINQHFFIGYGYNSVHNLFRGSMRIGSNYYALDAQNALLEYWLYSGILGVINLILIIYNVFKSVKHNNEISRCIPFIIGIYIFIALGMVEITINMYFFTCLAFMNLGFNKIIEEEKYENINSVNAKGK